LVTKDKGWFVSDVIEAHETKPTNEKTKIIFFKMCV
jgi:hypothetical protein